MKIKNEGSEKLFKSTIGKTAGLVKVNLTLWLLGKQKR